MKWIGILETRFEVEAETEEEARAKMLAQLVRDFYLQEDGLVTWMEDAYEAAKQEYLHGSGT